VLHVLHKIDREYRICGGKNASSAFLDVPRMRHRKRALAALAMTAAAACFTASAYAADIMTFPDGEQSGIFGANAIVRIDGSITYETHCPKPGIDDFFYPATDVYIVPTGETFGELKDASGGRPNTIVSGASAFTDEVIAMTEPAGNLKEGDYDVVYDTCQDGEYDPAHDTVFPHANSVRMPEVIPLADGGIGAMKSESRIEYVKWMATRAAMNQIFKQADKAIKTQCETGSPVGCAMKQLNSFGGIKERFLQLMLSQANHYLSIADDPPDASFDKPTTLAPFDVPRDHSDSAFGNAVADSVQPFAGEAAINAALLHAVERYQGAQAAGDGKWALVHAREARNLSETLRRIAPATSDALGDLKAAMGGDALDQAIKAGRAFSNRVKATGFTGGERRTLLNEGMTPSQIAKLETEVRGYADEDVIDGSAAALDTLDQLRAAHTALTSALTSSAGKWDEIVKTLEAKHGSVAGVDAGGPYTATEGAPLTLAGSGSGTAAWDLDGDGEFDDATGFKPSVTFARAGAYVIGVKAGDAVAYAVVNVADANHAPVLSPFPASRVPTITVGDALHLSAGATDPDGDPITYLWTLDGAVANEHDASLTFAPAASAVGSHTIEVTASDGPNTTRRLWDVVVVDKDLDTDGWTKTTDCDETDPAVHPTAIELLGNHVDDDCDTGTADAPPGGLTGSMMSWGSNHNGTVGTGSYSPQLISSPVPIPGYDNVVQVSKSDRSGIALLDNGEVRTWGFNYSNFGNATITGSATPVSPLAVGGADGSKLTGVTQIAGEEDGHVLARRSDGTVVAWGQNSARQIGDGSTVDLRLYPVQVVTGESGAPLSGVREVEAGISDSYAIMDDGTVRSWGYIKCDGGLQTRAERFPVPLPLVGGGVRQVAAGNQFTLILKKDGTVLSCGALQPASGRPLPGGMADVYTPGQVTGFGPGSGVIDIAAGFEGGMALKADGSVYAWGSNNNWELGILGYGGAMSVNTPEQVPLPPGPPVVDIEMDHSCHGLMLRADGSALGFGCDFFEQVGNGDGPGSGVLTPTVLNMQGRKTIALSAANWNGLAVTRPGNDEWKAPATWVRASVADTTAAEAGGGKFKISLSAALPYDVKVDWSAEAGTASSADLSGDHGTATVPAGSTSVEVGAPVSDDALDEDDETFTIVLGDPSNGVQLDRSQATVTITDDDAAPSVSVRPASVDEGNTSLTDVPVKVRLSAASGKPVTVAFATADGSAVSPADYAPASGRLVIAAGELEGIVHVAVRGDRVVEPDEALSVGLSSPENAVLVEASAALSIGDDDALALSVASPTVTEGNSGTTPATFTVALDAAPPASVSVDWKVVGVTATVPGDVADASGTLTFAAGEKTKQVVVNVKGDTEDEGDEAFRLALSNLTASDGRLVLRGEGSLASIVDDDDTTTPPPPPTDTTPPVTTASGNPSGWATQNVTVTLTATDNAGGSGVKQIAYQLTGAQTGQKTVSGASATVPITAEGTTTIAYKATDNAGNAEAEKTLVVRIDKTAPAVTCSASPGTLWPADHRLVPITVTVKVTDKGSGSAGFTLASVTSNEPDDAPGKGDGTTTGDIAGFSIGTADTSGQLRAERANSGHGRVYTLTYTGRDTAGNQRTCTTTVSVPAKCSGAHALKAAHEVAAARKRYKAAHRRR
jgi:alpha-tubulin suppressor-like RCC1 family protein